VDLSDNEITKIDGFPLLNRIRTLLLNNNKISKIGLRLGEFLPNVETIVLTNNKLVNLSDIDNLGELKSLKRLSLLDNLLTKKQHYRLYVIHKIPQLVLLDFRKIKQKERAASQKLFGGEKGKKLQESIQKDITEAEKTENGNKENGSQIKHTPQTELSAGEMQAIKDAIRNAKSIEEVVNLERALSAGQVPKDT
jgi:U2 small nuclear ribonucleoprotein A'